MSPYRPRRSMRAGARGRSPARSWIQLLFCVLALLFILLFMRQMGDRAAGCFTTITGSSHDVVGPDDTSP